MSRCCPGTCRDNATDCCPWSSDNSISSLFYASEFWHINFFYDKPLLSSDFSQSSKLFEAFLTTKVNALNRDSQLSVLVSINSALFKGIQQPQNPPHSLFPPFLINEQKQASLWCVEAMTSCIRFWLRSVHSYECGNKRYVRGEF